MAIYYFGTPTVDNGDGTQANPWNQAGFDAATLSFGDTLIVQAGSTLTANVNQLFASLPTNTASTRGDWLGNENQTITAAPGTVVAYGFGDDWSYRVVGFSGQISLDNATFGDPAHGTVKYGYVVTSLTISATSIDGSYDIQDLAAALAVSGGALFDGAVDLIATTPATVDQATIIDAFNNTGVNSFSISDTAANLASGTSSVLDQASAISLTGETAEAADLNTADSITTVVIDATNVGTIIGTAADVNTAYSANILSTITGLGNEAVTLSDASLTASVLNTVNANTLGTVDAASVTSLTGLLADLKTLYTAPASEISGLGDETVTITDTTGTLQAADLSAVGGATTGPVTVSNAQTVTGTSAELTAALVTPASKVVMGSDSSATVSDATSAATGAAIATTSNITATFTAGISDSLANLASSGAATTNLNTIVSAQPAVVITIADAVGGTMAAADLSAVGSATTGVVTVTNAQTINGTTDQIIAAVVTAASSVTPNSSSTINASSYTNQDLSGVASSFTLNVTTANGAVLDSSKLATADAISIGAGSASIDAASTDEVALANRITVNDGTTLTVNNYVNTDLSGLTRSTSGSIVVNTTTGADLDETRLADATSVVLGAAATGVASAIDGIGTNGSRINLNGQTLSVSGYSSENLSGITTSGTLNITTVEGAVLDASKLQTADAITVVGTNTASATDADTLGSRLIGSGTVNITTDPITVNTDLSDLGSGLTLQFGGATSVVVNDATLTVRQNQVSGYTISGTGTVAAAGTASADPFNASGISATLKLTSLAGDDSITLAPADLSSADSIDGGDNTDTLIFSAAASGLVDGAFTNVTNIEVLQLAAGSNTISLAAEAEQAGIVSVIGSSGADKINLDYGSTGLTFNAGDGSDTLSYSADSSSQSITLSSISGGTASGSVTNDSTDSFSGLEAIVAGSGASDSLTSTSSAENLVLSGANSGTIDGFGFSGVESINLAAGNDTATVGSSGSLSGTLNLGDGDNSLTFNSGAGAISSVTSGSGNDSVTITAGSISGALTLGSGTDTLSYAGYGSGVSATLSGTNTLSAVTAIGGGVTGVEAITLSSNNDTFTVANGGTLSGNLDLGSGSDRLSYSGYTSAVTVTLNTATSTGSGDATGISGTVNGFESLVGGSGSDTLNAASGINSLTVANGGATTLDASLTVSGFETINLGAGSDASADTATFSGAFSGTVNLGDGGDTATINNDGSVTSLIGGDGSDNLNLDGANQTLTITATGAGTTTGTSGGTTTFSGFESVHALAGSDVFIVTSASGTSISLDGGDGTDTLSVAGTDSTANSLTLNGSGSGSLGSVSFSGIESITLGSGGDTATINSAGSLSVGLNLGDGDNSLTFNSGAGTIGSITSGTGNDSITISAGTVTGAVNAGNGTNQLTISGSTSSIGSYSGGSGSDSLTLSGGDIGGAVTLGSGANTLLISSADSSIGGAVTFGADPSDTLSYAGYANPVTVSLNSATSTAAGGATAISGAVSGFESLVGGDGSSDVLNASSGVNSLNVAAGGTITLDTSLTLSGFETINLGSGSDSVTLAAQFAGSIDGGAGDSDVLTLNASANEVIFSSPGSGTWGSTSFSNFEIVNLLGGNDSLTINGTGSFTSVDGGSESDSLTLARTTSNDVVTVTSAGAGSLNSGGTSIGSFSNFESIDLGSGSDTLTYASFGSAVSLTLDSIASNAGTTTTGGATGFSGTVSGFESVVGSNSSDSLIASSADNTLVLTGANQGTLDGLSFSSFESVDLAGSNDTAQFTSGDSLSGTLSGGTGSDTLDYSAFGSAVSVNLATGTATGTGGISGFEIVLGGSGNDTITAPTSGDVNLQGNGGSDAFNVTIAGLTSGDSIDGGTGNDSLVFTDAGTITDSQFTNVSLVESVTLTGATTITLGSEASQAGIATVNTGTGATTVNTSSAGYDLTVNASSLGDGNSLTLTGSDATNDVTVNNLNGSVLASGTSGTLTINTVNAGDNAIGVTTGSGNTTVTASGSNDVVTVNADAMLDDTTLDLNGSATYVVSNLEADTDAAGTTGMVSLTYSDVTDNAASITTGEANTTITANGSLDVLTVDAEAMADDTTLDINGSAGYSITNLEANTDAAGTSGSVSLAYTDVTDDAASITTGSGATTVSGTTGGDTLTTDASNLSQNTLLTLFGAARQVVTGLVGNLMGNSATESPLTGTLDVTTGDAVDDGISITTGTNNTTIIANGSNDVVTVNADQMADNTTLDINGSATYVVSNLEADTDAAGTSGSVSLAYTDVTDNAASITTGSGATTVSGTTGDDTLTINATSLAQNTSLTLSGAAQQVVNNLVGDLSATALSGTLTVTTANALDNGISITTGSNNTTITANGSNDVVMVNADQMADNTTLDINGSATYVVSNLEADTDAAGSSGALTITYANVTDDKATLLSGSGNVSVAGGNSSDTITVTGLGTNNQTFNAQASSSNFSITAGDNNQTITGSNTGNDTIDGGSGTDTLSYAGGQTVDLTITDFADQAGGSTGQGTDSFRNIENLIGATGIDVLRGVESGVDEIATITSADAGRIVDAAGSGGFAFSSFEQIDLNAGNDVLALSGSGSLSSSADGGAGIDRLDYSTYTASAVTVNLATNTATAIADGLVGVSGDSSFEDVYGSAQSDSLTGDDTANRLRGNGGDDTILGLDGNDTIDGGDGTHGSDGADLIVAGDGADLILGSNGSDFISGGGYTVENGVYTAVADSSVDTLSYADENEGLDLSLNGIDQGEVRADAAASLTVSSFTSTYDPAISLQRISVPTNQVSTDWTDTYGDIQNLVLTAQNDIVRLDSTDLNTGSIDAGAGSLDTLDYSSFGASSPVIVNLSGASYSFDFDANGTIDTTIGEITITNAFSATNINLPAVGRQGGANGVANFEVVIGGAGDDAIVGNDSANLLVGNAGADRIAGGAGADTIYGGLGDDYIVPGDGADDVFGGAGINTIAITSSDLAQDTFNIDPNGINIFKLEGDGSQTSSITAPSGPWNPGLKGIDLLDGGDPVVTGSGSGAVTSYDTIQGSGGDDTYELGGTALKNIAAVDLGAGNDSVGTAASTKGIKVLYDGNAGADSITLNLTFDQFARLNASGLYVADVQNYLDNPAGTTFSSTQADFTATDFEAGSVAVITPAVYNALQGDPAALTFNSAFGLRNSAVVSGDDISLAASALTTSTATALSVEDIVSAFVQASGVKGSDNISLDSGASLGGSTTASQTASATSRTVDDRADSVLAAYALGTDRSAFTAGQDINLSLSGSVDATTSAESAGLVVTATGTTEAAGSRDSSFLAGDDLSLTVSAGGLQTVSATNVEGLARAGLASRTYGIDDANLTDGSEDSVVAGADLTLAVTASSSNAVSAQTSGSESLGTISLVNNGIASTDRFTTSLTGTAFPLINGDRIRFTTANGSVQADRDYYVLNVIAPLGEFQLSSAPNGDPIDVVANGTLQAYRPAVATADAISVVTAVDLNRNSGGNVGVQAGADLSLSATAADALTARASSVDGDATAGLNRLGALDNLNLAANVSTVTALQDTLSRSGSDLTVTLAARDSAALTATSVDGNALTEANVQVLGSDSSSAAAGGDLALDTSATLTLSGAAVSTSGNAEARSGAGAGAGITVPGTTTSDSGSVQPDPRTFSVVTALADGSQTAGDTLTVQARASSNLTASASSVDGSQTLGSLWTSSSGNILATFDLNLNTTVSTPSFVGPQYLADGQRVQLPVAAAGLSAGTNYAVRLLGFGSVDASTDRITMPTGITYANGDAVRFRLNSSTPANLGDSRYGIAFGTTYYVVNVSGSTFQLSASPGGAVVDLSNDGLGLDDQLVDADRFQLLTPPTAPGGTYSIATLDPSVAGVSLSLPSVANAFAGSREADLTLTSSDTISLAQVSGISGNAGLRSLQAGSDASINASADGVINAQARNIASDATASGGMVAQGISDTAISAGGDGNVSANARLNAVVDAASSGDAASTDAALANLNITARGITASDDANDINIAGRGDVVASAALDGRSTASIVTGAADALGVLQASGIRATTAGVSVSIGDEGDLFATARLGSAASPLVISALSSAVGDATAQAASRVDGILGSFDSGTSGFSSIQAGAARGDIRSLASTDQLTQAIATGGAAAVTLGDVAGSGSAEVSGIRNMALTAGADLSRIEASAIGSFQQEARAVDDAASSQASTRVAGIFSDAGEALPVRFEANGAIAALANNTTISRAISVSGDASTGVTSSSLGLGNASVIIGGSGELAISALSRSTNQAQSVSGHVSA